MDSNKKRVKIKKKKKKEKNQLITQYKINRNSIGNIFKIHAMTLTFLMILLIGIQRNLMNKYKNKKWKLNKKKKQNLTINEYK